MTLRFKEATSTIPIVANMADPIAWGVVGSLARPGGNITGICDVEGEEIYGKRLDLLRDLIPGAARVGYLASREVAESIHGVDMRKAAQQAGISLVGPPLETVSEAEYRRVFELMKQERADGLIVSSQAETYAFSRLIIELVEQSRLPTIFPDGDFAKQGGLIGYGTIGWVDLYRRLADYIDRILKGAKPGELPIELPTKFELVINLKTAKALGLTVPQILLASADEVIE
jgi:putative ABC transport system substrate-binding protein